MCSSFVFKSVIGPVACLTLLGWIYFMIGIVLSCSQTDVFLLTGWEVR